MKYLYGRPNADVTMELLTNSIFDLYLFLGKYAQFCSQKKYLHFDEFLDADPNYLDRKEWFLFRKGYCFVRDVIKPAPQHGVSGRMLRRLACKYPLEKRRIPICISEILSDVFAYVLSEEKFDLWHNGLQGSFYFACHMCLDNNFVERCIMCADRSLGFQMELLNERIKKGDMKARRVKLAVEDQFRKKKVVEHCDVGGV